MTNGTRQTTRLVLSEHPGLGRLAVDLEAFFDFSFAVAEDLQDLIHRWSRKAAPRVAEVTRRRRSVPR